MTHTYKIEGMHCNNCVAKIKSELLKLGDVESAEVQTSFPQATITMGKHIPLSTLQVALSKAGKYSISEEAASSAPVLKEVSTEKSSYFPIFLIFGFITLVSTIVQITKDSFSWMQWMSHFMAGFFLVFSFFKFMNLKGFAEGYGTYDVVAARIPAWGLIYPFVELGLGLAFLTGFEPVWVAWITLIVMSISAIGVINSLLKKRQIQCACLGTIIKLPLSKVTLFEDLLMVAMSVAMILTF